MIDLENQEREIINLMFSQRISWLAAVRIRHKLSLAEVFVQSRVVFLRML